jgi:hypothetical protein
MRVKSLEIFVRVLVFGLLLGASSTAYADTLAITSFTINNFQFTPTTGTAQLTLTGTTARAEAMNSFGENVQIISNTFPLAQATATVNFASAIGTANGTTPSLSGSTSASVGACSCSASSFSITTFTGTLVIVGAEGSVDVNISALTSQLRQVQTDQFGVIAESEILFDLLVNGSPVFSFQVDLLSPLSGPNLMTLVQGSGQLAGTIRLQAGVENTISARLLTRSWAVSEVPEPATVVLLISGLGFMTRVLKKRRKAGDE